MKIDKTTSNYINISKTDEAELFFDINKNTLSVKLIDRII